MPRFHSIFSGRFRRSQRGFVEVLTLAILLVLLIMLGAGMLFNRSAYILAETADRIRQGAIERRSLEQAVHNAVLAKLEVAPVNDASSMDTLIDNWCSTYNGTAQGITLTRSAASPSIAGMAVPMFPAASLPSISSPNLITEGSSFQVKEFIARGATPGTNLSFSFAKTVSSNTIESRTYTVNAKTFAVSMTNWSFIAYGLPGRGAVPAAAPANTSTILGSVGFTSANGKAGLLSTIRPSPAYSNGDTTAFDQLYKPPGASQPERLPTYYLPHKSVFWNAWEFIWSGGSWPLTTYTAGNYQDRLLYYATQSSRRSGTSRVTSSITDLSAFSPPTQTGVSIAGNTATINLGSYPEDILYVVDGDGSHTVNISGAASNALGPLVLVIANQGTSRTVINFSGSNARSVLIYTRNTANVFAAGTTFSGGIYMDMNSTASGTVAITGLFAFYGVSSANPFPALTLTLTPPSGALLTDLQDISPRALVVSTSSVLN